MNKKCLCLILLLYCVSWQSFCRETSVKYNRLAKCAQKDADSFKNMKIVGGETVTVGEAPFQVALFRSGSFICGGSLIANDRVITAAHCVYGYENQPNLFKVRYGTLYRNSGRDLSVNKIICHPLYSSKTLDYDIAILCLASEFTPDINAAIIPLTKKPPKVGSKISITGWGSVSSNANTLPLFLQRASNISIISKSECQHRWSFDTITPRMLCAFSDLKSSCTGDSGGPMIQNGYLVGVISWGSNWCLHPSHPGVYANVANLHDWIYSDSLDSISGEYFLSTFSYLHLFTIITNIFFSSICISILFI